MRKGHELRCEKAFPHDFPCHGNGVWGGAPSGRGAPSARERAGRRSAARARGRCGCALLVGVGRAPRVPGAAYFIQFCSVLRECAPAPACLRAAAAVRTPTCLFHVDTPCRPALPARPRPARARGVWPNAVEFWARVERAGIRPRARVGACVGRWREW